MNNLWKQRLLFLHLGEGEQNKLGGILKIQYTQLHSHTSNRTVQSIVFKPCAHRSRVVVVKLRPGLMLLERVPHQETQRAVSTVVKPRLLRFPWWSSFPPSRQKLPSFKTTNAAETVVTIEVIRQSN